MYEGESIFNNKIQDINATSEGVIQRSNNALFNIELGTNIFNFDPFFEGLKEVLTIENKIYYTFHCVNFCREEKNFYCDIIIKKESGYYVFIFFNYSQKYNKLQQEESKKNHTALRRHLESLNIKPGF